MYLRTLTLLVVIVCVAYAHTIHDGVEGLNDVEMITTPRKQVLSFEEEIKGMVDKQEYLIEQNDKLSNVEGKMVDNVKARDCEEWLELGVEQGGVGPYKDGVYTIYADDTLINVYCDMLNGGWTVLQKRTDTTLDYNRNFVEYAHGFGDVSGEHWLGLNSMNLLTGSESSHWIVHFELEDFEAGGTRWAEYRDFRIKGGSDDFTLTFNEASYRGTTGNGFSYQNGAPFTARDHDMDQDANQNCAADIHGGGGWWYRDCHGSTQTTGTRGSNYMVWSGWTYGVDRAIIKIKRDPCV